MDTRTQSSAPGASPHPSPAPSSPPSAGAAAPDDAAEATPQDNARRSREGQAVIARLGAPVRTRLRIGQVLVLLSAILAVAPYIALVQLGDILLRAHRAGLSPDTQQVSGAVMVLVSAYSTRLLRKAVQDDTTLVHTVIAHGPVERLNAIVTPLALLGCAFWIDWRLALLAVSTLVLYALTYSVSMRGMNEKTVEMDRKLAAISSAMVEFVSGIGVVKAFGRVGRAHSAYLTAADEFSAFYRAWAMPLVTVTCLSFTWVSIPVLLLVNLGGGALLIHAGAVTLPQVLATTLVALVLPAALITIASISWSYQLAGAAALRLCEVLDTPVLPAADRPAQPREVRVEIDHVSFSYGEVLAVDDACLTLEPGTVTALLGPSGSGKSTLATLIARFADPDAGAIRIGGVDLRDMDESTLYSTVSFVLQDAQLLATTVRENIALGRPEADLAQVRAAARVARIHDEIMALPQGYDTVLGQDTALSGGQEQRIAIARAILLNTPVIVLDEATAMADPESEAEIQEALSALVKDRTVLVIAHRPAAVRGADRIAVMDGGRIVAAGSHDDLADEPHYRALLRQAGEIEGATEVDGDETATRTEGPALADGAADSPDDGAADSAADGGAPAAVASHIDDRAACPEPSALGGSSRPAASLLSRFRRLMTDSSWGQTRGCIALAGVNGVLVGLALLVLLPASVALATGAPRWGLSFGGWLIVLVVLGLGAAVCDFQGRRMGMSGALGFMRDVHHAVGDRIARLPLRWFTADSAGTLSRAVSQEMVALGESAAHFMYLLTSTAAACVVVGVGSWAWDWRLGLLLTLAAPLFAGLVRLSRRLLDRGKSISEPAERELATRIVEIARCQGALRSCKAASGYSRLTAAFDDGARASRRALWWESAGNLVNGALSQIVVVAMIVLTSSLAASGTMEPLVAIAVIGMCLRFTTMLDDIGAAVMGVEERRQMMNHLDAVMDAELMAEPQEPSSLPEPGAVELNDVVFGYRPDEPVLTGVSMKVPARTMCAIVGPSGSGKTTIARLVARFWDVDSGTVRVGGTDVRDMPTSQLMEQLSMVFQDVYLFDDTLAANIRIGNPAADDTQVRWAADLAGVTEIVDRLPHGWDTRVGEGGRALSGGERQRVSIARALLKRAPIVLLDEATSALDAENEANIVAAMQELRRTSTLIVIAHKLETIAAADQVVVLDDAGHVAQRGHHDELVAVEGPYRSFWEQRTRARGWALV